MYKISQWTSIQNMISDPVCAHLLTLPYDCNIPMILLWREKNRSNRVHKCPYQQNFRAVWISPKLYHWCVEESIQPEFKGSTESCALISPSEVLSMSSWSGSPRTPETLCSNKILPLHNYSFIMQRAKNWAHLFYHVHGVFQHKPSARPQYSVDFGCYVKDVTSKGTHWHQVTLWQKGTQVVNFLKAWMFYLFVRLPRRSLMWRTS
jgi:hypothetical protein